MTNTRVTPNAEQVPVSIVGGNGYGRFPKISNERTHNMYVSTAGTKEEGNYEQWLISFPGYHRTLNILPYPSPYPSPAVTPNMVPAGQGRGLFNSIRGDIMLTVVNNRVFAISPSLGKTEIGTINTSSGPVFMAENLGQQICIVDGSQAWIYYYGTGTGAGSLTLQTAGALGTGELVPNYVKYHNRFFLFGNANRTAASAKWYVYRKPGASNTTIEEVIDKTLETKADFPIAVIPIPGKGNNVLVLGETVAEIHTQVNTTEVYVRNQSININYGCGSVDTIADGGDILAWLGTNADETFSIMTYDGNDVTRISTDGIDYLLSLMKFPNKSSAILYRIDGHLFYQLTFYDRADNITLLYDFNTGLFCNLTDQYYNFHPARSIVYFNLKTYFISLNCAALYEINSSFYTIDENLPRANRFTPYNDNLNFEIPFERITPGIRQANATRFIANSLVVTLEQGTDPNYSGIEEIDLLITESAFDPPDDEIITENAQDNETIATETSSTGIFYRPRIDLALSKDGGESWSNYVSRDLHPIGHQQNILHWESMGVANDLAFKFRFVARWRFVVNNAMLDLVV